jgi:formylglycine-generating enzyme required for sulfatase activity
MKYFSLIICSLLCILTIAIVISCSKSDNNTVVPPVDTTKTVAPVIQYLDNTKGAPGISIGIIGTHFGSTKDTNYVTFGGVKATTYSLWTDTKIVVEIPQDAVSGGVKVWVGGKYSNEVDFTIQGKVYMVETVLIPAGTFVMGPDADWDGPEHTVTLTRAFYMSKYEITQKQYFKVRGSKPSKYVPADSNEFATYPVEQLSWLRAIDFCNDLSTMEGLTPCYSQKIVNSQIEVSCDFTANGWRLPTEAEWEYACKAGATSITAGDIQKMGHTNAEGQRMKPWPVGTKEPNAW